MRRRYCDILLTIGLLVCFVAAGADPVVLFGRIQLEDHAEASNSENFLVQIKGTLPSLPPGHDNYSQWDVYSYRTNTNLKKIRLHFEKEGYVPQVTREYSVDRAQDIPLPKIRLHLVMQANRYTSASAMIDDIKQQLALFDETQSYDVFQYNLATLRYGYHNKPDFTDAIDAFQVTMHSSVAMAPANLGRQALYLKIVSRNNGDTVVIAPRELLALMQDGNTMAGIRAMAIKTLAAEPPIDADAYEKFTAFLHQQTADPANLLFRAALSALAKIGTRDERLQIIKDAGSTDRERAEASRVAVINAHLEDTKLHPETAAQARAIPARPENVAELPAPTVIEDILVNGRLAPGFALQSTAKPAKDSKLWEWSNDPENGLLVTYPADHEFGVLQIKVLALNGIPQTRDFSQYNELVVEMRSASGDANQNIEVGIKGLTDPEARTLYKLMFFDVAPTWTSYRLPLQGLSAQLSAHAQKQQLIRLQTLSIVAEISFGTPERQVCYIRRIYFARRD